MEKAELEPWPGTSPAPPFKTPLLVDPIARVEHILVLEPQPAQFSGHTESPGNASTTGAAPSSARIRSASRVAFVR
jgi:hypothetical protein